MGRRSAVGQRQVHRQQRFVESRLEGFRAALTQTVVAKIVLHQLVKSFNHRSSSHDLGKPLGDLRKLRIQPRQPLEPDRHPTRSHVPAETLPAPRTLPANCNPVFTPRCLEDKLLRVVAAGEKRERITLPANRDPDGREVVDPARKVFGDRPAPTRIDRRQQLDLPLRPEEVLY